MRILSKIKSTTFYIYRVYLMVLDAILLYSTEELFNIEFFGRDLKPL